MPDPIVHFEIPANDPARAKAFYEKLFGWKITYMPDYDYYGIQAKKDGVGIDGGMMKRKHPQQPFMNYLTVKSIDETLRKVKAMGGTVALERMPLGTGALAAFKDPEGNLIGLHEEGKLVPKKKAVAKKAVKKTPARKGAARRK